MQASAFASSSSEEPTTSSSNKADWDWAFVIGKSKGRKPAIKKPARHQWYESMLFCMATSDVIHTQALLQS
jgi:hypothetical protein